MKLKIKARNYVLFQQNYKLEHQLNLYKSTSKNRDVFNTLITIVQSSYHLVYQRIANIADYYVQMLRFWLIS